MAIKLKKTLKVNKNNVKSKKKINKKKINKKKTNKKKTNKKKTNKKKVIKKKKNSKKRVISNKRIKMEDIYTIINRSQLGTKQIVFSTDFEDSHTIENTIIDAEVKYEKKELKTKVVFTLFPGNKDRKEEEDALLEKIEFYEDEYPEDGILF